MLRLYADAVVRMLHLNAPAPANGRAAATLPTPEEELYKVLVLDGFTKDVLAPLLRVNDLRRHGVTLHLLLEVRVFSVFSVFSVFFPSSIVCDLPPGLPVESLCTSAMQRAQTASLSCP